jgi:hypothetical protein
MRSLNRHVAAQRVAYVYDTAASACDGKAMSAHVKSIRGAVEPKGTQAAEGLQAFIQQAGKMRSKRGK